MNEQLSPHNFSGNSSNMTLNSTLITMQIQALRQSLQRLVESEEDPQIELLKYELNKQLTEPNC